MKWHFTKDETPPPYEELLIITKRGDMLLGVYHPTTTYCSEYYEACCIEYDHNTNLDVDEVDAWMVTYELYEEYLEVDQ